MLKQSHLLIDEIIVFQEFEEWNIDVCFLHKNSLTLSPDGNFFIYLVINC